MNVVTRKHDGSLRFLRPVAVALSVAAFSGALLIGKPALADEPKPWTQDSKQTVTVAQGGPAAVGMPQPKEDTGPNFFEDQFVRCPKRGAVGKLLIIYDKTNGAVKVFDGDKEVGDRFNGGQIVVRPTKTGLLEVRKDGDTRVEIWVREEGSPVVQSEEESALDAACGLIKQTIRTGQSSEEAITEIFARISGMRGANVALRHGRKDQAQKLAEMYDKGATADQLLETMGKWGYGEWVTDQRVFLALVKAAADEFGCEL